MYKLYQVKYYYLIVAKISQKHINTNMHQIKKVKSRKLKPVMSYTNATLAPHALFIGECLLFVVAFIVKSIIFAKNKTDNLL